MGCFSPDGHSFCCKTIAGRIPQIKVLFNRNHMYMSRHHKIRIVKLSSSDHFTFAGTETDSLFPKGCSFICINVFFCRHSQKRQRACNLFSDLRICKSHCRPGQHSHLSMVAAGVGWLLHNGYLDAVPIPPDLPDAVFNPNACEDGQDALPAPQSTPRKEDAIS